MTHYEQIIIEATGCSAKDVTDIENIMRDDIFHSTLDWQTKPQLVKAAKTAQKMLVQLREQYPQFYPSK